MAEAIPGKSVPKCVVKSDGRVMKRMLFSLPVFSVHRLRR